LSDNTNGIAKDMAKGWIFIGISIFLIVASPLLYLTKIHACFKNIPWLLGMTGLFIHYQISINKNKDLPFETNGLEILLIVPFIPVLVFVCSFLFKQTFLISVNLTTKQYDSILLHKMSIRDQRLYQDNDDTNGEAYYNTIKNIKFKDKIKNIFRFICKNKPQSLLLNNNIFLI
jgi:hypothetical protein